MGNFTYTLGKLVTSERTHTSMFVRIWKKPSLKVPFFFGAQSVGDLSQIMLRSTAFGMP